MIMFGNGVVVTRDAQRPLINGGAVAVGDDGLISALGPTQKLRREYPGAHFVDARGGLIMPGLINLHHHAYYTLARGLTPRPGAGKGLPALLEGRWWRLDRAMNLEDVYHGAAAAFLECVRSGVTTVFDHHASYGAVTGSLSEISRAADELGLRACLCYEVSDREGESKCRAAIQENVDFIREASRRGDGMRCGMMGMHAGFTLSDRTLEACMEALPATSGCHIHVAECLEDTTHSLQTYGKSVVRRLRERGVLGRKTLAAHCIHLNWEDVQILRETDTAVIHCPRSNMCNAAGAADVTEYSRARVGLGLGTDGEAADMLGELAAASALCRHSSQNPDAGFEELPRALFTSNAAFANRFFETPLGVLKPGAAGDVIVLDYRPPTPLTAENLDLHLLAAAGTARVSTTAAAGKLLMEYGVLLCADEEKLLDGARKQAADLWRRVNA
ncbi:MAG: putative aminohydrolase SsnA [Lachnospiraceae bacterium]|uniref:Aminohydrolase SsnA n=1 Tax=Candidatus Scatomorpha intestinigallinarum TaxID=2840923 RepID=A0A9D1IZ11_9FIRM|nr:putative aminohydrolase SsnA [Candidatus Scatomorpha intestinigallinarum]